MTWIGIWPVSASCFRRSSSTKPLMSSRPRSSVIASGLSFRARARGPAPGGAPPPLQPGVPGEIEQDRGEGDVVLDDQHERRIAQLVAIVADLEGRRQR